MNLEGIIAIAGKPGLYKIVSRSMKGLLVESLIDGKRIPALATHKISALEDISMYTYEEDVPLKEIFPKIYEVQGGKKVENPKASNEELEGLFEKVLPDFDRERVYASDLKKLFAWYNLLHENDYFEEVSAPTEDAEIIEESDDTEDKK
ncbi:DUF5606 family protein [Luteibaculum oceani]|uniref:Uncharacterized protein n=1 Tax=Luteibaculum oceani TaxID=1294296 RepID=A0A5C6V8L2_9FLAO|nr:DUF5606 domain-containing protein [Luteibaculum oceani]TXC81732.1 hypothetical protein FRX97_04240 [Luteibaculum oceani]